MAFLVEIPALRPPAVVNSPFWWKTYGGYTVGQMLFLAQELGDWRGKRIYDPMSGQGYSLCQLSWEGAKVFLSDINPGPLMLASLRDPTIIKSSQTVLPEIKAALAALVREKKRLRIRSPEYCADWISRGTGDQLREVMEALGVDLANSPFEDGTKFWGSSERARLCVGLAVLAARTLTCFRATDNRTWLRRGGVTPQLTVSEAMAQAIESWESFAHAVKDRFTCSGALSLLTWNCENGKPPRVRPMDAVVVSPPYANRLDYSSLWAPETAVLSAIFSHDASHLKTAQVGSTVVAGRRPPEHAIRTLPKEIVRVLETILGDEEYASSRYYYPYFANYALSLSRSIETWAEILKSNGRMVVFVRDTVRKGAIFTTNALVSETARRVNMRPIYAKHHLEVVKHHIGLLRQRRVGATIHGLAQQEWWQVFQKS